MASALASVSLKMFKFSVKVFKSLYLLNLWIDLVDILPDVRYWSEVLYCILTHISDLEVKVTDFEILCLSFWLKILEVYLLKLLLNLVDTLPGIRYWSKLLRCTHPHPLTILEVKVTDFEILC